MWRGRQEKPWKEEELGNSAEGINSLNTQISAVPHRKERGGRGSEKAGCVSAADHTGPRPSPLWAWRSSGGDRRAAGTGGGTGENTHKE